MDKVYARINWENEPSIRTPINEINLNKMDYAVDELDNRVIELDNTKAPKSDMLLSVKGVSYNTETGVFTFTWWNGTTLNVDLNIEKIPVSFSMSETGIITMTTTDGTEYICDVASLIKAYIFEDSNQIAFTVNTSEDGIYHVTGTIKSGSITEEMLEPGILGKIANAQGYAEIASQKAENAEAYATLSKSYAVGGTDTREGEDADNAKYYAEQAKAVANIDIATTEKAGIVKPDGTSVTVDSDGTIHAQTGTNIETLNDIGDVNIQNPQDKQALVYDSETKKWKNGEGSVSPIDNLTSNSTTEPLSANQGRVLNNQKLEKEIISDEWNASTTYAVGQYCIHNNILWKCLVANTNTEPTEGTHWTKVSVANEITSLNSSLTFQELTVVSTTNCTFNGSVYKCGNLCLVNCTIIVNDIRQGFSITFSDTISSINNEFLATNYSDWSYTTQVQLVIGVSGNSLSRNDSSTYYFYRIHNVFIIR